MADHDLPPGTTEPATDAAPDAAPAVAPVSPRRAMSAAEIDSAEAAALSAAPEPAPKSRRAHRETSGLPAYGSSGVLALADQRRSAEAFTYEAEPVTAYAAHPSGEVPLAEPLATPPAEPSTPTAALAWVDPAALGGTSSTAPETTAHVPAAADLLPPRRTRGWMVAAPLITAGALALAYVAGCAFAPLTHVAPTVAEATVQPATGRPLGLTWPAEGSAAVGAEGIGTVASSAEAAVPMASIAKLISVLMILEKAPLAVGETGPSYDFTLADSQEYWQYLYANESALDVPIDGQLTQRQMLEGILIGSANNYIDRLAVELWGSKDAFVLEIPGWLEANGLGEITMVDASGIDPDDVAPPAALIRLASTALANPVVAEIVAMPETDLPGAGRVENSNPLAGEPGIAGIKTGTLSEWWIESWNLLTAKDITVGQTTVRTYVSVLGQPDAEARESVTRSLLDEVEASLQPTPSVPAGTTIATVRTEWGASAEVVTSADATVVLWDGGVAAVDTDYEVELDARDGATVGELTATGPFDNAQIALAMDGDLPGPSLLWRLSHPLALLGLD